MYTQLNRFVATTLLVGLLFQNCGSPRLKIVDDTPPERAGTKIDHPASMTQRMVLTSGGKSTEDPMQPKVGGVPVLGDEALRKSSTEALVALSNKAPDAPAGTQSYILHDDCASTHFPSASVNVVSQRPAPSSPPNDSSATSQRKQSIEKKPQHVALDQDAIARRKGTPLAGARAVPVVAARPTQMQTFQSTSALHAEKRHSVFSRQPQPTVQHALTATEHKEAHPRPAINPTFQCYPSAQGHQVHFKEVGGNWLAQVKDGWGRMQMLPVVFAPGQSPTQALYKLALKSTGQHKYLVHVLETSQTPWAPRVVYVGALGLRGGGFGSIGRVGEYTGKGYQTFIIASDWEGACREWEEQCQQDDREYFRREAPKQVKSYLRAQEYELYKDAFKSVQRFKEKFNPHRDIVVKACVKAAYTHSKFIGTNVLLRQCDLPQNPSPLALIQAYIDRADCLIQKLANTGQTDYALGASGLEEVTFKLQPQGAKRISDTTRSLLRKDLYFIKKELLSEESVASISAKAYMNWLQEQERRKLEHEARRARLDEIGIVASGFAQTDHSITSSIESLIERLDTQLSRQRAGAAPSNSGGYEYTNRVDYLNRLEKHRTEVKNQISRLEQYKNHEDLWDKDKPSIDEKIRARKQMLRYVDGKIKEVGQKLRDQAREVFEQNREAWEGRYRTSYDQVQGALCWITSAEGPSRTKDDFAIMCNCLNANIRHYESWAKEPALFAEDQEEIKNMCTAEEQKRATNIWIGQLIDYAAADENNGMKIQELAQAASTEDLNRHCCRTIKDGQVLLVRYAIECKELPVNSADRTGNTLLHQAVQHGQAEIVSYLIGKGADKSAVNRRGVTPLSLARASNNAAIIALLE